MRKIKENFRTLRQDKIAGWGVLSCLLLLGFHFLFFIFHFKKLPPQLPLFYSRPWGEEQLGLSWQLTVLPFLTLLFFVFDLFLASKLYHQYPLLAQILVWTSFTFTLLATITLVKIIFLVT